MFYLKHHIIEIEKTTSVFRFKCFLHGRWDESFRRDGSNFHDEIGQNGSESSGHFSEYCLNDSPSPAPIPSELKYWFIFVDWCLQEIWTETSTFRVRKKSVYTWGIRNEINLRRRARAQSLKRVRWNSSRNHWNFMMALKWR